MPTGRGWVVAATGLASAAVGLAFGADPLVQVGCALVVLVLAGVVVVRGGRHDVEVRRKLSPDRVPAGRPVAIEIRVTNRGRGRAPLLLMEDRLPARVTGNARFALSGVEPGGVREASLNIVAHQRGRYAVGPMQVSVVDPFGLARRGFRAASEVSFLVHPMVHRLGLPRDLGERHGSATALTRQITGSRGEDFYTLREYVPGDDLRKIHWTSTAKRGRFMLRQEETPWQARASVLLDDRAASHGNGGPQGGGAPPSFERAVEAAASCLDLFHRVGYSYRLTPAVAGGRPTGRGGDHLRNCMDLLATIQTSDGPPGTRSAGGASPDRARGKGDPVAAALARFEGERAAEACLVVITGTPTAQLAAAVGRVRARFRQVVVVMFPALRFSGAATLDRWEAETRAVEAGRLLARAGVRTLVVGPDDRLGAAWETSVQGRAPEGQGTWALKAERV